MTLDSGSACGAAQVVAIDSVELGGQGFAEAVKGVGFDEPAVGDEGHDAALVALLHPVGGQPESFHIRVVQGRQVASAGGCGVGFLHPAVDVGVSAVVGGRPGWVADDDADVQRFLPFNAIVVAGEQGGVHRVIGFVRLKGVGEHDAAEGFVLIGAGPVVVSSLDVDGGDVVGQQHNVVGVQFAGILAGQAGVLNQPALQQAGDKSTGADERLNDMHALIAEGSSELGLQGIGYATDDIVHHRERRIDDAELRGGLGQGQFEEAFIQLGDDLLAALRSGYPFGADAHIPVEAFQPFRFLFQAALLQAFYGGLHGL